MAETWLKRLATNGIIWPSLLVKEDGVAKVLRPKTPVEEFNDENVVREIIEFLGCDLIEAYWPEMGRNGLTMEVFSFLGSVSELAGNIDALWHCLDYAEWELENGGMKNGAGEIIDSPVWHFCRVFLTKGYYKMPDGYVSAREQFAIDQLKERQALDKAGDERLKNLWRENVQNKKSPTQPE